MELSLVEILSTYRELGYGGLLTTIVFLAVKYLLNENKKCYEKYEAQLTSHKDEIKILTEKMFSVLESHTTANINLNNTIKEIFNSRIP